MYEGQCFLTVSSLFFLCMHILWFIAVSLLWDDELCKNIVCCTLMISVAGSTCQLLFQGKRNKIQQKPNSMLMTEDLSSVRSRWYLYVHRKAQICDPACLSEVFLTLPLKQCRDGCSFMWHQPCQRYKYTTSVDIQNETKMCYKASHSCRTTCERSESAQESRE